ncbi:hypothetical protein MHYP_G00099450 [Metynnis hypsauchen]
MRATGQRSVRRLQFPERPGCAVVFKGSACRFAEHDFRLELVEGGCSFAGGKYGETSINARNFCCLSPPGVFLSPINLHDKITAPLWRSAA